MMRGVSPFARSQRPLMRDRNVRRDERVRYSAGGGNAEHIAEGGEHIEWFAGLYLRSGLKVLRELGLGTFGCVLECLDEDRGQHLAVKVIKNGTEYKEAAEYEAEILRIIYNHNNKPTRAGSAIENIGQHKNLVLADLPSPNGTPGADEALGGSGDADLNDSDAALKDAGSADGGPTDVGLKDAGLNDADPADREPESVTAGEVDEKKKSTNQNCIVLYDWFIYEHKHMCLVTEKLGPSLYQFMYRNNMRPFQLKDIQVIAKDILSCLVFLKELGLTHTDLKLENVLFVDPELPDDIPVRSGGTWKDYQQPNNAHVKVADFGGATFARDEHCPLINTRQYRAPEVILNLGWNESSDMWSFGCIVFELYAGQLLFRTHDHLEHLHLLERYIGRIPSHMLKRASNTRGCEYVKRYNQQKCFLRPLTRDLGRRPAFAGGSIIEQLDCGVEEFNSFVCKILTIDPDRRPTPREMMDHPFLHMTL
ncbi:protein kinase [Gregarina niphandrodes]|uniref:Protein kinase n=1 Tax=Gregarina niphandrodes TaxID=110365 RepID=A0A023AYE3_GRENI|nr:protein kinase [Gregarina niphandrodes]EZG43305.1 protein kinase [Gregarina niphandrodes]|eukprot:XP_011133447.1 protein kinase [Gregarina niphandrodes]